MRNKLLVACVIIMLSAAAMHLRLGYSLEKMLPVFAAILAGMFFCDLDAPFFWMRQKLVIIVMIAMAALFIAIYYFYTSTIMAFCPLNDGLQCGGAYFFIALAISALFAHFCDVITPFKEGPLHGVLPSLAFGLVVLGAYSIYFGMEIAIIGGVLAFSTAVLHLILDSGKNN
ncbi:hypothetical protein COV61_02005 [Candidatus Micrarchaeota archaeon CG11_big_fil_rev_8_21_14_0_20_47_5]|nr:MAG: hypothetical protein AUJ17_04555 [Candidatus Micrarchaeota archaeon CG1_02_47_40]PIN83827.1 MAG: hypothetical protein COV61_02005 [Candidatus Micrarchaeota archaeon CG11_big_fil_rev_8_21_14_0_20_47_5]